MKFPLIDHVETGRDVLPRENSDLLPEDASAHDVLFEMGVIVAAHLAVALSVVLTLRVFGFLGG